MAESDRSWSSDGLRPGEARIKKIRGIPWGTGGWKLAEMANSSGEIVGCGAHCGGHVDEEGNIETCKKQVAFGKNGLTTRYLILRLKRWLIASRDVSHWDEEWRRSIHVSLGGRFLLDFCRRVV